MKRVVWKYPIRYGLNLLEMPEVPEFLSVGPAPAQQSGATGAIWVAVFPEAPKHERRVKVIFTGEEVPMGYDYLGSYQTDRTAVPDFTLVMHVYVERR